MNHFLRGIYFIRSKKLSRGFSIYAIGKVISLLLSFFLLPLFTKKLPPAEFGVIGLLWLINPILSRIINLGMDVGISIKFFKQADRDLSLSLYNGLSAMALSALLVWGLGCFHIKWIQLIIDKSISSDIFTLLVVSALFSAYSTLMCSFLQNAGKAASYVVMTILPALITVGATYIFVIYIKAGYTSYIGGMALSNGITGIIALGYFLRNYPIRYFRFYLPVLKNLLRIGLPVLPGTIGTIILASGDRYMIKYFIGLEAVAIYTFGYRFSELISQGIFDSFQKAFTPILYEEAVTDIFKARKYNIRVVNQITIIFSITIAAVIIPLTDIIDIIGGSVYKSSYLIFLISLIGAFIYNVSQAESCLIMFTERTEINMLAILIGASTNIGLNFVLIPRYGMLAAAYTTIISYLVMMVLKNYFLLKFFKVKNLSYLVWRIIPFTVYVYIIYCVDILLKDNIAIYGMKCLVFTAYIIFVWFCFAEYRNLLKSIVLNRRQPIRS